MNRCSTEDRPKPRSSPLTLEEEKTWQDLKRACLNSEGHRLSITDIEQFKIILKRGANHGIKNSGQGEKGGGPFKNQATIKEDGFTLIFEIRTNESISF